MLKGKSLALVQFKGGTGKTTLTVNLAACAADIQKWRVAILDLDANAPLSASVLGKRQSSATILEALDRVSFGRAVDDLLVPAQALGLGVSLLPGDIRGIPAELIQFIPALIKELLAPRPGKHAIDLLLIDPPGENKAVNLAVLRGVDTIAMPLAFSALDITAAQVTIGYIHLVQQERQGAPVFLGLIPNAVVRWGGLDRAVVGSQEGNFITELIRSGKLLPFIPNSQFLRKTFVQQTSQGRVTVPGFAPGSAAASRLAALWAALSRETPQRRYYEQELRTFLGLDGQPAEAGPASGFSRMSEGKHGR